mmetsp:Transcript_27175/g.68385  ORF Transcript_27175/g.68385 Transcript_27175/m.68385 type:complete len:285 (+) Transcript_27175:3257-4111(+)
MSSTSTGLPMRMLFSSVRRYCPSVSLITRSPLLASMAFTHALACPCGSIMSGQRRALAIMMPLSMEKLSLGSPWMAHSRILTGSPSASCRLKTLEEGMPFSLHSSTHFPTMRSRYTMVKAPRYEMRPALMSISPVKLVYCTPRRAAASVQRTFSPPSPPISFSARSSFCVHSSTSPSSRVFSAVLRSSCASIVASFCITSFRSASLAPSSFITSSYSACAISRLARLGATTLATLSYESMAHTHLHMPSAALEALAALVGVKSGLEVYVLRMASMTLGGTLSLS